MSKDDIGCLGVLLLLGSLFLGMWLLWINPSMRDSNIRAHQNVEFRRICADVGGTALTDTSEMGDICVKEFITIRQGD